jgi:hypothetical protein
MVKIGNIVTFGATKVHLEQFHIHDSVDFKDNGLPTLYIGYTYVEETLGSDYEIDFINRKLSDNQFWTTNRIEDRYLFNNDLEAFVVFCENKILDNYSYRFINPLDGSSLKQIYTIINHIIGMGARVFEKNKMVYFQTDSTIFGFNTEFGAIYGIPEVRIMKFIHDHKLVKLPDTALDDIEKQFGDLQLNTSQLLFIREKFTVS